MKRLLLLALVGITLNACPNNKELWWQNRYKAAAVRVQAPASPDYVCYPIEQESEYRGTTTLGDFFVGLTVTAALGYCLMSVVNCAVPASSTVIHVPYYGD